MILFADTMACMACRRKNFLKPTGKTRKDYEALETCIQRLWANGSPFFSFLNNRSYIEAAPKADSIVPEKQNEAGGVGMKFAIYSRKSKATDKGWIT